MEEKERLKKHLEYLCSFDKLTGEPDVSYRITCNNGNQRTLINS